VSVLRPTVARHPARAARRGHPAPRRAYTGGRSAAPPAGSDAPSWPPPARSSPTTTAPRRGPVGPLAPAECRLAKVAEAASDLRPILSPQGGVATCPSIGPKIPQKQYIIESFHAVKDLGAEGVSREKWTWQVPYETPGSKRAVGAIMRTGKQEGENKDKKKGEEEETKFLPDVHRL